MHQEIRLSPEEVFKDDQRTEERPRGLGLFSLKNRRLCEDLRAAFKYPKRLQKSWEGTSDKGWE